MATFHIVMNNVGKSHCYQEKGSRPDLQHGG
jgi:hypothetical protein